MNTFESIPFLYAKPFSNFSLSHINEEFQHLFQYNTETRIVSLIEKPPIDRVDALVESLFRSEKQFRSFTRICLFYSDAENHENSLENHGNVAIGTTMKHASPNEQTSSNVNTPPPNEQALSSAQLGQSVTKNDVVRDWNYFDAYVGCEFLVQGLKCMNCVAKVKRTLLEIKLENEQEIFRYIKLVKEGSLCVFWNQNEMTKIQQIRIIYDILETIGKIFTIRLLILPITIELNEFLEYKTNVQSMMNNLEGAHQMMDEDFEEDAPLINESKSHFYKKTNITNELRVIKETKQVQQTKDIELDDVVSTQYTAIFHIEGMHCGSCVSKIEDGIRRLSPTIQKAEVSLMTQEGRVEFDSKVVSADDIAALISSLGFLSKVKEVTHSLSNQKTLNSIRIVIQGMHCQNCVSKIQLNLSQLPGIESINVSLKDNMATIQYDSNLVGIREIVSNIENLGFNATVTDELENLMASIDHSKSIQDWRKRFLVSLAFCIPVIALTIYDRFFLTRKMDSGVTTIDLLVALLSAPVLFYAGWHFHSNSLKSLNNGYADMNVLISIGTMTAYFSSLFFLVATIVFKGFSVSMYYFETAAMTTTFQSLGKYLEVIAKGKTSSAITSLMKLQARKAVLVLDAGAEKRYEECDTDEIDTNLLQSGDIVKIFPGSVVPGDGVVVSGNSLIDESMLTGESRSVPKNKNDRVYGGTINKDGILFVRITEVGETSFLSQIVKLVKDAQSSKAPIQKIADRISKVFVPFIIGVALITFIVWFFGSLSILPKEWIPKGSNSFLFSIGFPMAVLVIACPCALGLATPTAVLVSTGIGAQMGVLIKGGEALETSHNINAVIFDKTGTLTIGKPVVAKYQIFDKESISGEEFFSIVLTVEKNSEHPVGRSIVEYASHHARSSIPMISFSVVSGKGVLATLERRGSSKLDHVIIGNKALLEDNGIKIPPKRSIRTQISLSRTVVLVALNQKCIGYISLQDQVRPEAAGVVRKLHQMNIKTFIISGDQKESVDNLQKKLKIHQAYSQVLPQDKARLIRELKKDGFSVCMIGDGINDSPALVEANLGMAIGAGTDIAIQSANVVLVRDDLRGILVALDLARTTYRRIKLNHFWAFGYNIIFIPLACGILYPSFRITIPPILAACTMMFSSLLVITSSLLLRLYKAPTV